LKVSSNVKIAMQYFENSVGEMPQMLSPWLRAWHETYTYITIRCWNQYQSGSK